MDTIKFLTTPPNFFSGYVSPYEDSQFIVFGVPFDGTSSYKPGSRFGPSAIREASCNIETFSLRTMEDIEHLKICDIGDLWVIHGNLQETNKNVERLTSEIIKSRKIPIMLGGEHSVTYGAVKALGKDTTVVQFDAHMDLRNDYLGEKWSHASVMRRISEEVGVPHIIEVGTRAPSKEEYVFAKENKLSFLTSETVNSNWREPAEKIKKLLQASPKIYLTIDIDCLDPSVAPGVGNPEPEGISLTALINIIQGIVSPRVKGFDVVEVSPPNDPSGITSVAAAKLTFELISMLSKTLPAGES
ncbi:MAG: agmatinase [Promethearchaeati archaeon SRVP18_Atabeyarchaeia-1]